MRKSHWGPALALVVAMAVVACGGESPSESSKSSSGGGGETAKRPAPPTANTKLPTSIGQGEGKLSLIAWEGYTQPDWVKPFEQETGCKVSTKYGGSSDEMVTLMRQGGGAEYDMVSASGDASLRLIYGGDVQPVNPDLIPDYKDFIPQLQSPPHNTIDGKH
jgi:putative spermidine/putrescine transport system substrate-binding protein